MKTGIIVCSYTGNTLSVAEAVQKAVNTAGGQAVIDKIKPVNEKPGSGTVEIAYAPDTEQYGMLVFAAPVHGFSLAPLMKIYLSDVTGLKGKKIYCFVTQHFSKAWAAIGR